MNARRLRGSIAALMAVGLITAAATPVLAADARKLTAVVTANDIGTPTAALTPPSRARASRPSSKRPSAIRSSWSGR